MDSERIEELLEKYWKCETSVEEEAQLHEYFRQPTVPESLKETAALFRYFGEQRGKVVKDTSFDKSLIRKIRNSSKGKVATLVFNTMRIAAGIIVLVLAVWLVRMEVRKSAPDEMADTYDDPKMAFEETKKALMMISRSFSTAEEQAKKINLFNEAQQDLKKEEANL
jgi:hypothetical protein